MSSLSHKSVIGRVQATGIRANGPVQAELARVWPRASSGGELTSGGSPRSWP
jgi:hypothetical protein